MKNLIFLLGFIILTSCGNSHKITISKEEYNNLKGISHGYPIQIKIIDGFVNPTVKVIEADSCEYFTSCLSFNNGFMTHKGNCKFCQQRLEQTIRKIIQEERKIKK